MQPKAWFNKIKFKPDILEIIFEDGAYFQYSAEYLKVENPDSVNQACSISQHSIVAGCRLAKITNIEAIGNYAIKIYFKDDSGIYSWDFLYELGEHKQERWKRYLYMLKNLGLERDRL